RARDSPFSRPGEAPRGADRWHRGAVARPGPRAPALPPRPHALALGLAGIQTVGVEADVVLDVEFPVAVIAILLRVPVGLDVALRQGVQELLRALVVHVVLADVDPDLQVLDPGRHRGQRERVAARPFLARAEERHAPVVLAERRAVRAD